MMGRTQMDLSVIIPTLNEDARLPRALASLPEDAEVIVSDGQSNDRTADIAACLGARVVVGPGGRGAQMNLGAKHAAGKVLLFLHADCQLSPESKGAIEEALSDPRVVGGSFRLRIAAPGWGLRLLAFGSNLRARFLRMPYGDQGLFVRRADFDAVGGYPETPLMEDVDLVRRLRRRGRLACLRCPITTGPRHWEALGPFFTTLVNWMTVSLFLAGFSAERLAPMYRRLRRGRPAAAPAQPTLVLPNE